VLVERHAFRQQSNPHSLRSYTRSSLPATYTPACDSICLDQRMHGQSHLCEWALPAGRHRQQPRSQHFVSHCHISAQPRTCVTQCCCMFFMHCACISMLTSCSRRRVSRPTPADPAMMHLGPPPCRGVNDVQLRVARCHKIFPGLLSRQYTRRHSNPVARGSDAHALDDKANKTETSAHTRATAVVSLHIEIPEASSRATLMNMCSSMILPALPCRTHTMLAGQ
jgi:hypothetical protein